jgi:hypothetical protein
MRGHDMRGRETAFTFAAACLAALLQIAAMVVAFTSDERDEPELADVVAPSR